MNHPAEFLNVVMDMMQFARVHGGTQFPAMGMGLEHDVCHPDQTKLRVYVDGAFYIITAVDVKVEPLPMPLKSAVWTEEKP